MPVRFGVVGADHLHLFSLVDGLVTAGAEAVCHAPTGDLIGAYEGWQTRSEVRSPEAMIDDATIDLVVLVGVASERAAVAVAALKTGKAVLSAKPGVASRGQLDAIRSVLRGRPGRPWTVLFSERFENRAIGRAVKMAREGAVGRVVHVAGNGPHALGADTRPAWFWEPERSGGILVDLGSHQVDQFLSLVGGPEGVEVGPSRVGNVACPDHPAMQDVGTMTLLAPGVVGEHRVDYLSPAGLESWGDVRLSVVGTTGSIEVRANIDVTGAPGAEHLIVVDAEGARRIDVSSDPRPWAAELLADLADDGERLMTQEHVLAVCDLSLRAQENALPWGSA